MKINRITQFLFTVFSTLTLILFCFVVFLCASRTSAYAVQTDSMSPVIQKGDVVFIRRINPEELKPGDIVTVLFDESGGVFTHRITRIDKDKALIYTKGDKNPSEDPAPADMARIVGLMWFSLPLLGYISFAVQSRILLILLAAAAIVLVTAGAVLASRKTRNNGGDGDEAQKVK